MTTQAARGVLAYVIVLVGSISLIDAAAMLVISSLPTTQWNVLAMAFCIAAALGLLYILISVAVTYIRLDRVIRNA